MTSGQERTLDRARTPSRDDRIDLGEISPQSRCCWTKMKNFESEDGERRENTIRSASKVIIAVAVVDSIAVILLPVTKLRFALILLLVDPFDDVRMAVPRRIHSATASAPMAGRVLCSEPLQNFKVPSFCRKRTSPLLKSPRARRVLRSQKLQNVQVPSFCRKKTSVLTPRARWIQTSEELQSFKVPSLRCPVT